MGRPGKERCEAGIAPKTLPRGSQGVGPHRPRAGAIQAFSNLGGRELAVHVGRHRLGSLGVEADDGTDHRGPDRTKGPFGQGRALPVEDVLIILRRVVLPGDAD